MTQEFILLVTKETEKHDLRVINGTIFHDHEIHTIESGICECAAESRYWLSTATKCMGEQFSGLFFMYRWQS
jgi:hypothetical protein